jgi:orotidine-5'-phosphate decarboxylase
MVTPIVALDVPDFDDAMKLVHHLGDSCRFYKVGSQLFTSAGPRIVTALRDAGCQVFLDLKFHDIPNTVQKAAASAAHIGASLITVHASGGEQMLRAAVEGAGYNCRVLAVTILTSLDAHTLSAAWGKGGINIQDEVLRLATIAFDAHAAGVVCSGLEAPVLHAQFGQSLKLLVPGIRLPGSPLDDQARTVTPAQAAASGVSYIVLGRTVTLAQDPVAAMKVVAESVEEGGATIAAEP